MAFSKIRTIWPSTGEPSRRPIAAPHGDHSFLPQDSVIISDRTRHANKLGEGSFAKVYRREYNGKPCAVKVFKEDVLRKESTPDPGGTSEVEVLSKLQHTNIVKMYGMWLDPYKDRAAPSIVMELCGESLYDFSRRFKGKLALSAHMYSLRRQSFHREEGGAKHPPERIKLDAPMDFCRECIEVRDGEIKCIKAQVVPQKMEAAPVPLPYDVADVTADEGLLQQLCYMATGIKQLLISPNGGTFKLGSGDASLEFPPGTVEKETSVRYAIILHGPFVFHAGYKPGSVIIYLNMEGATLLKPVLLYLSHWCIKEDGEDEDTLKFVSASHTLEGGQQVFEEENDAEFTHTNVAVLSIHDPHCLFCVETKKEKVAMYSAIAFSHYIPSEETLLFRIQLMCDSLEWNEKLTTTLQQKNWEKTSDGDVVIRFQYADGQHQITASPKEMSGPGWEAAICGQQGVMDQMFLGPLRKSKDEVEQEIISGRFPPCILYQIIYNSPEEKRIRPALLKVDLHGANVPLSFSCLFKEEMCATPPVFPAYPEQVVSASTPPIPTETCLVDTRELADNQRASEANRNELVAAKVQKLLAEKERDEQAEKCLLACQQRETFRNEAEEKEKQLKKLKEYYERASKRSEQTAEENQRLLASNDELTEKVQEFAQASQALQKELSEKQQCLDEQQREITALTEKLSSLQEMEIAPVPLASDVIEETGDEVALQRLCYMATGIKQLLVGPDGGTFVLGSGDATLEFPEGAIVKQTSVRYAIILHGPFVFPAGHNLVSVVVYLNMEGAILMKPVLLYLSHWCIWKDGDDAEDLMFATAPHTLMEGQEHYQFKEQGEADFITHTNVGILKILEPRCLHCVKGKPGEIAMYRAITFTKYIRPEETLLFRIQLMCDSPEWNEGLLHALQGEWNQTSSGGVVTRFEYAPNKRPIAAGPDEVNRPGWIATREGSSTVELKDSFLPRVKTKDDVEEAIRSGQHPPCILYNVLYTAPEDQRVKRAKLTVALRGEDLDLLFSCQIMEAVSAQSVNVARSLSSPLADISNTAGAATPPSPPQAEIQPAEVIEALNHDLDAQWREFGTHLCVKPSSMDIIDKNNKSDAGACMLQLVEKWLVKENGTGDLPRTRVTVVQAVKKTGKGRLAEELAQRYGVQLPGR